jgi:pimeloyl-ACP methyl ester carboxylesterase
VPVQIVQGESDQYGTIRQVEVAQEECYCPVEVAMIAGAGHSPQRERPEVTLDAIAGFVNRVLKLHHEGDVAGPAP